MAFLKSCLYVIIIGVAAHYVGEALPRRWFHWDRAPFRPFDWERDGAAYERIRIQDWKDHMPDMSRVMKDMVPKKVGICPKAADIRILIRETCVAEAVHWALCLCAPVIYLFWRDGMGIFLTFVFIACNIPFILIQRYNRPALVALAHRLELREERKKNACTHSVG